MAHSQYLSGLNAEDREKLEHRLHERQKGQCFICSQPIDLLLHKGQLDIDHIDPLVEDGLDSENNFALTHAHCNRSKGAANLQVARRLAEFEHLQEKATKHGQRGANLGDVLEKHGGAKALLRLRREDDRVELSFSEVGDNKIRSFPLMHDKLSGMNTFFACVPLEYLHHDDLINPRPIGSSIRGLIEEFLSKNPQLHVTLAWWAPQHDGSGPLKVFDGQHKAAAQILLGIKELPVRIFVEPNINVLLDANTNAGSKLRQVAFNMDIMRHLGSTLYLDRIDKYRQMRGLQADDYSFSESDLVKFFRGERKEMARYIVDSQRDAVTHDTSNKLLEFVEWAGKGADRPLAYSSIERSFFKEFLYKKALDSPIDEAMEQGRNSRILERQQLIRLMSIFADVFFVNSWDPEIGGRKIENKIAHGETVPEPHLRAWRVARDEVIANILAWVRLVIENYYAFTGQMLDKERLLHQPLPDILWDRITNFLRCVAALPCWVDKQLGTTVFGPKQNLDYWERVFKTGKNPGGIQILAKPFDVNQMIQGPKAGGQ